MSVIQSPFRKLSSLYWLVVLIFVDHTLRLPRLVGLALISNKEWAFTFEIGRFKLLVVVDAGIFFAIDLHVVRQFEFVILVDTHCVICFETILHFQFHLDRYIITRLNLLQLIV